MSSARRPTPSVLLLVGELFGRAGGIERVSRLVVDATMSYAAANRCRVWIVSRNDSGRRNLDPNTRVVGCGGSRIRFVAITTWIALRARRPIAHGMVVGFAPLLWLLRVLWIVRSFSVHLHGIEVWSRLPARRRSATQRADVVVSVSAYTASRAASENGIRRGVEVIHPALPSDWITAVEDRGPRSDRSDPVELLTVTRLVGAERYKSVDDVLESLAALRSLQWRYSVIGTGDDLGRIQALASEIDSNRIVVRGSVEEGELHDAYRDAEVFVLPSTGEGFGFVFIEAMAHGCAVVAANVGGPSEIVTDGVTGMLVDPGDRAALTAALEHLLATPSVRAELGRAAAEEVRTRFAYDGFEAKWHDVLGRLRAS